MTKFVLSMGALVLCAVPVFANPHGAFVGRAFVGPQVQVNVNRGFVPFRSAAFINPGFYGANLGFQRQFAFQRGLGYGVGLGNPLIGQQLAFQRQLALRQLGYSVGAGLGYGAQAQFGVGYGQAAQFGAGYGQQQQLDPSLLQSSVQTFQSTQLIPVQTQTTVQSYTQGAQLGLTGSCGSAAGVPLGIGMGYGVLRGPGIGCR